MMSPLRGSNAGIDPDENEIEKRLEIVRKRPQPGSASHASRGARATRAVPYRFNETPVHVLSITAIPPAT
jgi:hypothetical protein